MSCGCTNSKRNNWQTPSSASQGQSSVTFRYIGATSLTVTGSVTRQVYRFTQPGDEVMIDNRDLPGMAYVPNVTQILQ